jgi:hypothetical protein
MQFAVPVLNAAHRLEGIDDQVRHRLLRLHPIASDAWQIARQLRAQRDAALDRFALGQGCHLQDRRIEVDDLLPGWRFLDESPDPVDDVAGSIGVFLSADSNPMAITGDGRSRATESDGGQARRAKGAAAHPRQRRLRRRRVNSVGERSLDEPRGWSWFRSNSATTLLPAPGGVDHCGVTSSDSKAPDRWTRAALNFSSDIASGEGRLENSLIVDR